MRKSRLIGAPVYIMAYFTVTLITCGGESGGIPRSNTGVGQVRQVSGDNGRTIVLRGINTH